MRTELVAIVVAAAGALGCASATSLCTARNLAEGETQLGVGLKAPWPVAEVGIRRGLTDRIELGAQGGGFVSRPLTMVSALADVKAQLHRAATPNVGWDLALDPSVGYESFEATGAPIRSVNGGLALLVGHGIGNGHQVVLGPRMIESLLWDANSEPTWVPSWGASLAVAFAVSNRVQLIPECTVMYSPVTYNTKQGIPMAQCALGVLVGNGPGDAAQR
ncbi:MAG: hypothetical protein JST54_15380 [Deltaproteobacteria bacterium]|nr:hypothetical protein [Deltaproteobacteria bacterium]